MSKEADKEYDLFGGLPPHQKHSKTSLAAASSIKQRIGPLHKRILDWMERNPAGGTDEWMMESMGIQPNTFRPRRRELQLMGRIKDSGNVRLTKSGRLAVVWVLA